MGFDDISPPTISTDHPHPNLRVHLQFFDHELLQQQLLGLLVAGNQLCDNQALRLPANLETWPRAVIFDFVYGAAALHRWYKRGKLAKWEADMQELYCEDADYDAYDGFDNGFDTDDSRAGGSDEDGHDGDEKDVITRQRAQASQQAPQNSARFAMDFVYTLWQRRVSPDVRYIKEWLAGVIATESD